MAKKMERKIKYRNIRERLTTSDWGTRPTTDRPRNGSVTMDTDLKPLEVENAPQQQAFCIHYSVT